MERMAQNGNIEMSQAFYMEIWNGYERSKELEEENKKLKEENEYRKRIADVVPEGEGHIAEETIQDLQARIKELKEELKKYKKLHKYSNGELQTYSGD